MLDNLFSSVDLLQKGMDASWLRNEVIGNNIANIDTPGFKASGVQFENIMASALGTGGGLKLAATDERHLTGDASAASVAEPLVVRDDSASENLDGNNVDIESEMVALAKNSIEYYTLVNKINGEFNNLNKAINVT